jgi:2-oxo-3-(phosphooxy)propyl 3-oxoalkanoate synthase
MSPHSPEAATLPQLVTLPFLDKSEDKLSVSAESEIFAAAVERFEEWSAEFQPSVIHRMDQRYTHKVDKRNALLAKIEALTPDIIIGEVVQDTTHPFFYEHALDHVSGLYQIEAARQFGIALSHKYYRVPFDGNHFLLDGLKIEFHQLAELDLPLFVIAQVSEKMCRKNGQLRGMRCLVTFFQQGERLGHVEGWFRIVDWAVFCRIRDRMRQAIQHGSWERLSLPKAA